MLAVKCIVGFGFLVYFIGLFSSRLLSSEMLATIQIAYFGLFIVNQSDPLIEPLRILVYSNGYNRVLSVSQQHSPDRVYAAGFMPVILGNLNLMLLILVLPPLAAFIFYRIHLRNTRWRIRMSKVWRRILGEYWITAMLFTLYNFSASLGIFFLYS